MKKKLIISGALFLFLLAQVKAQRFLQGLAVFAGETSSRDRYVNSNPLDFKSDPTFLHAHPPSHQSAERESWSVGVFAELLKSYDWRWVTEISYCNKGANENELTNPITDSRKSSTNKYGNLQWNNYLKRWVDLGTRFRTYIFVGARAEYTLLRSTPAYSYISGNATRLTVSPDCGLGAEFHLKGPWNLFVEWHYNSDILKLYDKDKVWLRNRMYETRVGIIYRFKAGIGAYDLDCNAPRSRR